MDAQIGELMPDVVEGEVIDVDEAEGETGLDSEVAGVDAQVEREES
jgi:hypothetical protein